MKKQFAVVKLIKQTTIVEAESKTEAREAAQNSSLTDRRVLSRTSEPVFEKVEPLKTNTNDKVHI
jgi:hypothetical protein